MGETAAKAVVTIYLGNILEQYHRIRNSYIVKDLLPPANMSPIDQTIQMNLARFSRDCLDD